MRRCYSGGSLVLKWGAVFHVGVRVAYGQSGTSREMEVCRVVLRCKRRSAWAER